MDKILESRPLKGLSEIMFAKKRKLTQAQAITTKQITFSHRVLEEESANIFDRAASAFLLTGIYGRCRASEDEIVHDHNEQCGYVEVRTAVHKTGRSAAKKAMLLPILIPAIGITGSNWAVIAQRVFDLAGLKFSGKLEGPLLRPPKSSCIESCTPVLSHYLLPRQKKCPRDKFWERTSPPNLLANHFCPLGALVCNMGGSGCLCTEKVMLHDANQS